MTRVTASSVPAAAAGAEPGDSAARLDAWLDEAGRMAGSASEPAGAAASAAWIDELRTLCLLHCGTGAALPELLAPAYLKALAVRGQLCLRRGVPRQKRALATRNLANAAPVAGLGGGGGVWQARVAMVHARLLCAVGGAAERQEALAVLQAALAEGAWAAAAVDGVRGRRGRCCCWR